jgi:hypothetical protein
MRATLEITGTATLANLLQDIISMLTGETDKNNLITTQLVLGSTSITANTASGWELWDSDAGVVSGSTSQVIRAPCVDDPTQFKYMQIYMTYSSSYYRVYFALMEGWDAGTNTPTRKTAFYEIILGRGPSASYGNTIFILQSTARYIFLANIGSTGDSQNDSTFPCLEINRTHPCLAIGTGRLPAVSFSYNWYTNTSTSGALCHMTRFIDDAGSSDVLNPLIFTFVTSTPSAYWTSGDTFAPFTEDRATDKDGGIFFGAYLLQFDRRSQYGHIAGTSEVSHVYIAMYGEPGPANEEISYLKNVGMVRCRKAQFDLNIHASPRWLLRVEDE